MTSRVMRGFSGMLLAAALAAGCSSGDEGGADAFVGMWQYTSGMENTQCPGTTINSQRQLQGTKETFAPGVSTPLINSDPGSNCTLNFNVSGSVATAVGNQSCQVTFNTDQGPINSTLQVTSAVFTVTGTTARYSYSANFNLTPQGGGTIACMLTGSGDLMRISK